MDEVATSIQHDFFFKYRHIVISNLNVLTARNNRQPRGLQKRLWSYALLPNHAVFYSFFTGFLSPSTAHNI